MHTKKWKIMPTWGQCVAHFISVLHSVENRDYWLRLVHVVRIGMYPSIITTKIPNLGDMRTDYARVLHRPPQG
jgi:hypothetical protein